MENPLISELHSHKEEALRNLSSLKDLPSVQELRVQFLGKKGLVTATLKKLSEVPSEQRAMVGKVANTVKTALQEAIEAKIQILEKENLQSDLEKDFFDISLPGLSYSRGTKHPIVQTLEEVENIFQSFGFEIHTGPDIETEYYNFEALNIPEDHPARDMQDTLYLADCQYLLRTHTSPVQIRVMEKIAPPVRIIAPGSVYRHDHDVSHTPMFHQVEGLLVDEGISFAHLKGVLTVFIHKVFGPKVPVRFRPSFFPFTEPSAEVDMGCVICQGKGCRVCKNSGWLEIMGCGMVDPEVFASVHLDSERFTGFAFGMGIERIAMLKYSIGDIRLFFENDLRFLRQF